MVEFLVTLFCLWVPFALFMRARKIEKNMESWGFDMETTARDWKYFFSLHRHIYNFFMKVDYEQEGTRESNQRVRENTHEG